MILSDLSDSLTITIVICSSLLCFSTDFRHAFSSHCNLDWWIGGRQWYLIESSSTLTLCCLAKCWLVMEQSLQPKNRISTHFTHWQCYWGHVGHILGLSFGAIYWCLLIGQFEKCKVKPEQQKAHLKDLVKILYKKTHIII